MTVAKRVGRRALRATSALAIALGAVLTCLVIALAYRLDQTWEVKVGTVRQVSERTRNVLADTQGTIKITCFMDRRHPMFRPVSRLLRGLQLASRSVAGAEIVIEYVDPRWDLTRAGVLAAWGVPANALLFERQRRRIIVTLDEMLTKQTQARIQERSGRGDGTDLGVFRGEMVCASAVSRLAQPYERSVIYWLQGHGESSCDDYDELRGFSDIARELKRDGFEIRPLTLPGREQVPADGHVLVIAGARQAMAVEELNLIEAFLRNGGRLLVLVVPRMTTGLEPVLEKWGIRQTPFIAASPQTLSGQEVVLTSFADHVITRNLSNASVVFGYAVCLEAVTDASAGGGADRPKVTLIARTGGDGWGELHPNVLPRHFDAQNELRGPVAVVAVSERGGMVSKDVAFKPTRVCVIGETDFVMNGALATRANANRDLFMNAVSWLAGIDTGTATSLGGDSTLVTGFSRRQWVVFMLWSTAGVPAGFLFVFSLFSLRMRR